MIGIPPQQPHLIPNSRHARVPGPDPVPKKRRSTPKKAREQKPVVASRPRQEAIAVPVTPTPEVKPRKGKGCGSRKPRSILTRALIKLALSEGHYELIEERQERLLAQQNAVVEATDATAASPVPEEARYTMSCTIGADGSEVLEHHIIGDHDAPLPPEQKFKSVVEIMAEMKVRRLLEDMKLIQVAINVGELVKAAKANPRLNAMLKATRVPLKKSGSSKAKTHDGPAAIQNHPSLGNSHRSLLRGKERAEKKKAKAKKGEFH